MPVNPTNKDAKERLKTEKKISAEQQRQRDVASEFRNIQNEIKDALHNMTLSQQTFFRTQVGSADIEKQIHKQIKLKSTSTGAEAQARGSIISMMKEGLILGAQSLTDMSKHEDLSEMIKKAEQEKIRITSQFRGKNIAIGEDLKNNLDVLIEQLNVSKEYALEQKRIQELTATGTDMMMSGWDAVKNKIESLPGGKLISQHLQLDVVGQDLQNTIGENLSSMLDPRNLNADKFTTGFQNIGKAGAQAFTKLGTGINMLTAQMAANPILLAIIAATVAIIAMIKVVKMGVDRFKELDNAAKDFRETTGMIKSQTEGLDDVLLKVNEKYRDSGITIEKASESAKALHEEFGRMKEISEDTVGALSLMSSNFGILEKDSAGAMRNLMHMGKMSSENALNLQAGAIYLAEAAGVAPADVMADIADSSSKATKYFRGNTQNLVKASVYARRLGLELDHLVGMAEGLLDFENSINKEMEASVLLGRQINFDKARQLVMEGDIQGAADDVLSRVSKIADFNKLDFVTKQAIADAVGLEVGQLEQALIRRQELAMLTADERAEYERREKLLDKINKTTRDQVLLQKEMQSFGQLMTAFWGKISEIVGNMFLPTIKKVSGWMEDVLENSEATGGFFTTLSTVLGFIGNTVGTIFTIMMRWYGLLYGGIMPVFQTLGGVIDTIKGVFKTLGGIFTGDLSLMEEGVDLLVEGIKNTFKGLFNVLTYPFTATYNFVTGVFTDLVDWIGNIFGIESLGQTILSALEWPFKKVWDIVTWPFQKVWDFLKAIPLLGTLFGGSDEGGGDSFISYLTAPFEMVWSVITWPFRKVWDWLKAIPLLGSLFGGTSDGSSGFIDVITYPFSLVYDIITAPFRLVWNFLKSIPVIGRLFGGSDGGESGGLLSSITSAFGGIYDAITWPFRKVWNFLKGIPIIGRLFGGGDSEGEGNGWGITDLIGGAFSGIAGLVGEGLGAVKDFATSAWEGVKGIGSDIIGGVKNMAKGTWDSIKGIGESAKNIGQKAWDGVTGLFQGGKELATKIMDNMPFKNIGSTLTGLVSGFGGDLTNSMNEAFTGGNFKNMLSNVQSSVGSVFTTLADLSPFKAIGGAISDAWNYMFGDDEEAAEIVAPEELNQRILEKLDVLIAAVQANGGDIILDGKKVGTQIAKSSTSAVRG